MLRRFVWSRNIKNGCSIYIYDISHLRVNLINRHEKFLVATATGKPQRKIEETGVGKTGQRTPQIQIEILTEVRKTTDGNILQILQCALLFGALAKLQKASSNLSICMEQLDSLLTNLQDI